MSFTNHKSIRYRPAIICAVAILHAAAIYAIVTGLGVKYVERVIKIPLGYNIPDDPPPPEPAKPEPADQVPDNARPVPVPQPRPWEPGEARLPDIAMPGPLPLPGDPIDLDLPRPAPSSIPADPRPRGNPGLWATTSDYPTRDIRQGNEGTARFLLSIDARGRVQGCTITRSSGHPGLDAATCRNVTQRAKFEPATDANGGKVMGTYQGSIKWVIPD